MRSPAVTALLLLCAGYAWPATAAGDAQSGRLLAQQWCSNCHIVGPSTQGPDTAPPFPAIARRHPQNDGWVRSWLSTPHPPMPDFNLGRQQIDDIVAYLESLTAR
jgi:mono/diheme cytochrome c family protein